MLIPLSSSRQDQHLTSGPRSNKQAAVEEAVETLSQFALTMSTAMRTSTVVPSHQKTKTVVSAAKWNRMPR